MKIISDSLLPRAPRSVTVALVASHTAGSGNYFEDFSGRPEDPPRPRGDGGRVREPDAHQARDEHGGRPLQRGAHGRYGLWPAPRLRIGDRLDGDRPDDPGPGRERHRRARDGRSALSRTCVSRRLAHVAYSEVLGGRGQRARRTPGSCTSSTGASSRTAPSSSRAERKRADQTPQPLGQPVSDEVSAAECRQRAPGRDPHRRSHAGARGPLLHDAARRPRRRHVKIEDPEKRRSDPGHAAASPRIRSVCDYGGYFASINRNKRSIAIDLKSDAGRDVACCAGRSATPSWKIFAPA